MHDDAKLVEAAAAGDRDAFGQLYDRYAPLVRAVCYGVTRDLPAAQDLCQEVFLRAYRGLGGLADGQRFGGWIVTIARRTGQNWLRRRSAEHRRVVSLDGQDPPAQAEADGGDDLAMLEAAIESLPERERLALHAFYLLEQSPQQAAEAAGVSRSGLYNVLARARQRLARKLRADGRQSHV